MAWQQLSIILIKQALRRQPSGRGCGNGQCFEGDWMVVA